MDLDGNDVMAQTLAAAAENTAGLLRQIGILRTQNLMLQQRSQEAEKMLTQGTSGVPVEATNNAPESEVIGE